MRRARKAELMAYALGRSPGASSTMAGLLLDLEPWQEQQLQQVGPAVRVVHQCGSAYLAGTADLCFSLSITAADEHSRVICPADASVHVHMALRLQHKLQ
jgi:hypothetical protein